MSVSHQKRSSMTEADANEIRAHLYQQLADVEALLPPGAEGRIQFEEKARSKFEVSFTVTTGEGKIESTATGKNVYEAMTESKEQMIHMLEQIYNASEDDTDEKDDASFMDSSGPSPWIH